jgi:hypothetical protein
MKSMKKVSMAENNQWRRKYGKAYQPIEGGIGIVMAKKPAAKTKIWRMAASAAPAWRHRGVNGRKTGAKLKM